jgi:hypothetical protein
MKKDGAGNAAILNFEKFGRKILREARLHSQDFCLLLFIVPLQSLEYSSVKLETSPLLSEYTQMHHLEVYNTMVFFNLENPTL